MFEYYENIIQLNLPTVNLDTQKLDWKQYNPRKNIARWGASITSLDGKLSGIPDLDSIYEYNKIHNTNHTESSFNHPTENFKYFDFLTQHFDLGRSHFLKLGQGGFFPPHRDFDPATFRIIYTISGCEEHNLVWILNGQVLRLQNHKWYYINTKMIHSVFSFYGSEFVVFNAVKNQKAHDSLIHLMSVK